MQPDDHSSDVCLFLLVCSVFWDLYCAAPERRDTCDHSSEAKAFHDYVSILSVCIYIYLLYPHPMRVANLMVTVIVQVKLITASLDTFGHGSLWKIVPIQDYWFKICDTQPS